MPDIFDQIASTPQKKDIFDSLYPDPSPVEQPEPEIETKPVSESYQVPDEAIAQANEIGPGIPETKDSAGISKFIGTPKDTFETIKRQGALAARSFNEATAGFMDRLDKMATKVSELTGLDKGGLFEKARDRYLENAEEWNKKAGEHGLIDEIVGEIIGGAVPGVIEFSMGPAYSAATGYAEGGVGEAAKQAAERYALGQILHGVNNLKVIPRTVLSAAVGGTQAAAEGGTPREIAKGAATLGVFGATARGGKKRGIAEAASDFKKSVTRPERDIFDKIELKPPKIETVEELPPTQREKGPNAPKIETVGKHQLESELIDLEANEAATSKQNNLPEPTEPQQQAGNYKKGHVNINGLDISIENPAGSVRKGKSPDGTEWETEMKNHYGYFKKTKGPDKDHVDVFLGPDAAAEDAQSFIVDQIDPKTGKYDEPKVMMGFKSKGEAQEAYLSNYEDGWQGIGAISDRQSPEALKSWLFDGDTTKPFGYQESAVKIPDFKDTNQAVVFGEKATPEQVKELERLHKDTQKREAEFKAAKDFSDDRTDNAFRGQLYREALEASRGEHAVQRDKRTPQQMLEDGKKRGKIKPPWEMTEDEYKEGGWAEYPEKAIDTILEPDEYKQIEKNEGKEARDLVYELNLEGIPTLDTHLTQDGIIIHIPNEAVDNSVVREYIKKHAASMDRQKIGGYIQIPIKQRVLPAPETAKEHISRLQQKMEERKTKAQEIANSSKDKPIIMTSRDERGIRGVIIHKSSKRPGKFQLTNWDEKGFSGDTQENTLEDAIEQALLEGHKITDPNVFNKIVNSRKFNKWSEAFERNLKLWSGGEKGETVIEIGEYSAKPKKKPKKRTSKGPVTLRGRIKQAGGINFMNFTGELKQMPTGVKFLSKKTGVPIDSLEKTLKAEGWLQNDETLLNLLNDKEVLKRGKIVASDTEAKTAYQKEQERKFKESAEYEPVEPPPGDYVEMRAEDLPEGAKLTIIEGSSLDGWDEYEIDQVPSGVRLKDGTTINLEPWDTVQVRRQDLPKDTSRAKQSKIDVEDTIFDIQQPAAKPKATKREKAESGQEQKDMFGYNQSDMFGPRSEMAGGKEPETTTKAKTEAFEPSKVTKRKQPSVPSKRSTIKYIPPTQRHSQIIKDMSKVFDVPIRVGKYRVGKRAGIYKQREKVIRVASANDIQTVIHENGHHIQDILGWPKRHRFPKEVQNMAYAGATNLNREGFAEFVRYYVTDEAYARKHAPTFYKEFEDHLAGRPEFQNVIIKARQAYNEFKAAPSVAKVASFIVNGDDVKGKSKFPTMGEIYTELKDSLHPIRKVVEIAKKQNGNMRIKDDPYIVARLLRGWARKAQQWVSHSPFQYDEKAKHGVKWVSKGLIDILTPIERAGKMRLFNTYLFAKRAIHDERIIRGFDRVLTIEDFKQTVKELESEFKETAKELYEYNDHLLTYLTNAGRISEESAKAIRANNLFYTPLYRLIEQSETVGNLGQKANNVFNPIKRLKGSSRDILSPTENILRNTYAMINAAERNMLGNALAKLSTVEGMGKYIEKIPFPQRPVKLNKADFLTLLNRYGEVNRVEQIERSEKEFTKSMAGLKKKTPSGKMENVAREALQSRGWTEAESDQIISRIKGAKSDEVRDDIIEKTIEKTTIMIIKEELGFANMPDQVIATFRPQYKAGNNEAIFYQDGKPVLYELDPDIYKAISSVSANEINLLIKFMSFPAKWLRAGATTFSPEFGIRNPMRDQMTAWIQSEYGFVPGVDFMRGALHMMKADESWQLFNVSGAAHSSIVSMDREYLSKNMKQLFRRKKFKGLTLNPLAMMQGFSELTEEASRVSEFTRALKKEGSGLDALFTSGLAGREVSLDFSRVGGSGAKAANMISAFWNARLEGLDKMARTFKKHPIKASSKAILGITLPSILLWYAQKDDPVYQELPSWRKTLFWNWVFHRDGAKPFVLSIPKPFEYGLIFGSLPVATLDWSYRNDPTMFQEVGESIMKTFDLIPIPTLGVIGYEWFSEKSWFFDRPVVPRDKEDLEPVLQYTGRTPESVKLLAEVMDKVPIIREVASPAKIENLIQGFTASGGRTALQALDYMLEKLNITDVPPEPSMTLSDMPGIRAIFSEFPKSHSQSIERFYKEYRKKKRKFESNKERMGIRGAGIKGTGFSSIFPDEEAVAEQLSLYRKLAKATYKSRAITPERKRFLLDLYYISMANEARKYFGLKPIINNAKK